MADHALGERKGHSRIPVRHRDVDRVVAIVAHERGVAIREIRPAAGPTPRHREAVEARREVFRRLARPNISINSIAAAWPCHHTTILHHLGRLDEDSSCG